MDMSLQKQVYEVYPHKRGEMRTTLSRAVLPDWLLPGAPIQREWLRRSDRILPSWFAGPKSKAGSFLVRQANSKAIVSAYLHGDTNKAEEVEFD